MNILVGTESVANSAASERKAGERVQYKSPAPRSRFLCSLKFVKLGPSLPDAWPILAVSGPKFVDAGRMRIEDGRTTHGQSRAETSQSWSKSAPDRPNSTQIWSIPESGQVWSKLSQIWAPLARSRPNTAAASAITLRLQSKNLHTLVPE